MPVSKNNTYGFELGIPNSYRIERKKHLDPSDLKLTTGPNTPMVKVKSGGSQMLGGNPLHYHTHRDGKKVPHKGKCKHR